MSKNPSLKRNSQRSKPENTQEAKKHGVFQMLLKDNWVIKSSNTNISNLIF